MQQARYMRAEMRLILQIVTCLIFVCLFPRSKTHQSRDKTRDFFLVCTHRFGPVWCHCWGVTESLSDAQVLWQLSLADLDLLGADDECAAEGWNHCVGSW